MAFPETGVDTLTDDSLGRAKIDKPGQEPESLAWDVPAEEYNRVRNALRRAQQAVLAGERGSKTIEIAEDGSYEVLPTESVLRVIGQEAGEGHEDPMLIVPAPTTGRVIFARIETEGSLDVVFADAIVEGGKDSGNTITVSGTGLWLFVAVADDEGARWTVQQLDAVQPNVEPFRWTTNPVGPRDHVSWPELYAALLDAPLDQRRVEVAPNFGTPYEIPAGLWSISGLRMVAAPEMGPLLKTPIFIRDGGTLMIEGVGPVGFASFRGLRIECEGTEGWALATNADTAYVDLEDTTIHSAGPAPAGLVSSFTTLWLTMRGQSVVSVDVGAGEALEIDGGTLHATLDGSSYIAEDAIGGTTGTVSIASLSASAGAPMSLPEFSGTYTRSIQAQASLVSVDDSGLSIDADTVQVAIEELDAAVQASVPTSRTVSTTGPLTGGGALSGNLTLAISPATPSTPGSMSAAQAAAVENLTEIRTHSGSSATLGQTGQQRVTYSAGAFTANLPTSTSDWPIGASRPIVKDNASVYAINLTPDASHSINGGTTGVAVALFGSAIAPATTDPRPMWLVTRTGSTTWSYS